MAEDSRTSGASHGNQFFDLLKSIQESGLWDLCNSQDPYKVWLLEDGSDWRWMTYSGAHRTAAIACLGIDEVHAELMGRVAKSELKTWPNVLNGWFTAGEAEFIFNTLYSGLTIPATEQLLTTLKDSSQFGGVTS